MKPVLAWLKSNVLIVILGVVTLAAPAAAFFVSSGLNAKLVAEYQEPASKKYSDVSRGTITYTLPGLPGVQEVSETAAPNEARIEFFRREREARVAALERLEEVGTSFNRGGDEPHGVMLPELLPDAPASSQSLRFEMASLVTPSEVDGKVSYYEELFEELGFRGPADNEAIAARLQAELEDELRRSGVESRSELSEARQASMNERLLQRRLDEVLRHAQDTAVFAEVSLLEGMLPQEVFSEAPDLVTCWAWQFDAWVITDALRALQSANAQAIEDALGVPAGPVKRVLSIELEPFPISAPAGVAGGGGAFDEEPSFGRGGGRASGRGGGRFEGGPSPRGGRSFGGGESSPAFGGGGGGATITGRVAGPGPTYDVRVMRLSLVVDSSRIPEVLSSFSRQNFIAVRDADVTTVDVAADLEEGYAYGTSPVVRLDLEVESVWLRSWTKETMPGIVKQALGIADEGDGA